jgi:hypothetical protein
VIHHRIPVILVKTFDMAKRKVLNHRLRDIHSELKKLKRLGPTGCKKFFKTCSKECVIKVCECIKNVLNSKLQIKPTHLKKLNRYKQTLRTLALRSTSLGRRKRFLQKGGLLATLLPAVIPAIASVISGLVNLTRGNG